MRKRTFGSHASRGLLLAWLALSGSRSTAQSQPVPGVRFSIDTSGTSVFLRLAGQVEFGAGRGRIDVSGVASRAVRSINGVTIGAPAARPGDYYLFDSTGYVVVRPSTRTFSVVLFTSATYRHGNVRESWDDVFDFSTDQPEDVPLTDSVRLAQHGAFAVRWHLDRLLPVGPAEILARGRVLVADAPRGEAGVVRWMGVAPALATLRDSISPLDSDLQLTTVAVLPPQSPSLRETNRILLLPMMRNITLAGVDVARLVLPADYKETSLTGSAITGSDAAKHWLIPPRMTDRPAAPPNRR